MIDVKSSVGMCYTYQREGIYSVTLTVTDQGGSKISKMVSMTVK
jgi:PKD repeat protein